MFIGKDKLKLKKKVTVSAGGTAREPTNAAVPNTSATQAGAMRGVDNGSPAVARWTRLRPPPPLPHEPHEPDARAVVAARARRIA